MGAVQIATSVTIISSLKGFMGVSLTEYTTSALSAIASGSVLEIGSAFFHWTAEETPQASTWTSIATASTAYLKCIPSGSEGSQILTSQWTTSAPTWREDFQGWYASAASSTRVIGSAQKAGAALQEWKTLYIQGRDRLFPKTMSIGPWDMDATAAIDVTHRLGTGWKNIYSAQVMIRDDTDVEREFGGMAFDASTSDNQVSITYLDSTKFIIARTTGGQFDNIAHDASAGSGYNRGYILLTYEA